MCWTGGAAAYGGSNNLARKPQRRVVSSFQIDILSRMAGGEKLLLGMHRWTLGGEALAYGAVQTMLVKGYVGMVSMREAMLTRSSRALLEKWRRDEEFAA